MDAPARRQINMALDPKVFENLRKRAQAMGLPTGTYAKMLFEAAYAARIGQEKGNPTPDKELDRQVRAIFCMAGDMNHAAIADALGVSRGFVLNVIKGWQRVAKERSA